MKKNIALLTVLAFMLNMAVAQERTRTTEKAEPKQEVREQKKVERVEPKAEPKQEVREPKKVERVEPAKPVKAEQPKRNDRAEPAKQTKVEHPKQVERAEIAEPARPDMQESKTGEPDRRNQENKEVKSEGTLKRGDSPDKRKERK
jgi:hypothetical protein